MLLYKTAIQFNFFNISFFFLTAPAWKKFAVLGYANSW